MRATPGILCLVVALSGCGASEKEDLAGWARDADEHCETATSAIARRGPPTNVEELLAVIRRGTPDARAAIEEVLALKVPERSKREVEPVRSAMRLVDTDLVALSRLSGASTIAIFGETTGGLQEHLEALATAAHGAGLRTCGRPAAHDAALEGLKGPVFEAGFLQYLDDFVRKLAQHRTETDGSPGEVQDALIADAAAIGAAQTELDTLRAPWWARSALKDYNDALFMLRDTVEDANEHVPATRAAARGALARVLRAERKHLQEARHLAKVMRDELGAKGDPGKPA